MFKLSSDIEFLNAELSDVVRLFSEKETGNELSVDFLYYYNEKKILITLNGNAVFFKKPPRLNLKTITDKSEFKRFCKNALYKALSAHFGCKMPWGSLTGIRPTKLVYEFLNAGNDIKTVKEILKNEFFVSSKKADLACEIVENQKGHYKSDPAYVNLYVHIPFCPSRCYYCSFISQSIDKQKKLVQPYIEKLIEEIRISGEILKRQNKQIYSVYIGGGTPTALNDEQFFSVLSKLNDTVKTVNYAGFSGLEFTCEAGRPDTVTNKKIEIMKKFGVNRVSCNPQSLKPATLAAIGRSHTAEQFYKAFGMLKEAGFKINTDLIAGLNGEDIDDFTLTIEKLTALKPDNITVHTLSKKRGSYLKEQNFSAENCDVTLMTDFALKFLRSENYKPYYLYRQKQMLGNLENVGYTVEGGQCVNNITVMEEFVSVMACGAGAISKLVLKNENRIERLANIKDVSVYIDRFYEQIEKKKKVFWRFIL